MISKFILFVLLLFFVVGLNGAPASARDQRVLVIGDSLMAWNGASGNSVADAMDASPGLAVTDKSIGAARYFHALPISGSIGLRLSAQFRPGNWDWVVLNGGGNDLLFGCGCGNCQKMLDRLVSKDGRNGAIPEFVASIRKSGAKVLYVGYLRSPGLPSPIRSCRPAGDELDRRLTKMSKARDGVTFLPLANLVPTGDRSFHAIDMIHPSVKGSRTIAARIVNRISE